MESAVRYDFSFPPKSSSLNSNNAISNNNTCAGMASSHAQSHHNNLQTHTIHNIRSHQHNPHDHHNFNSFGSNQNGVSLSKSASTSLLNCVSTTNSNINNNGCLQNKNNNNNNFSINNNNNNNNNNLAKMSTKFCSSCSNCKDSNVNNVNLNRNNILFGKGTSQSQQGHQNGIKLSALDILQNQTAPGFPHHTHNGVSNIHHQITAPATPKNSNCSFTFDDLKNTLAFMEDSPVVSQGSNANNGNSSSVNNSNTSVLMVIPNVNSTDSASSLSSSSSSSSSSCNSCCVQSYLPKSNSNPMLYSSSSSSTSSTTTLSTSPSSNSSHLTLLQQNSIKNDCVCSSESIVNSIHQYQTSSTNSVLDLFIKKSNTSDSENSNSFESFSTPNNSNNNNGTNSLITTANSLNLNATNLLTSVQNSSSNTGVINTAIENAAKKYRCAAQISEATCCWKGKLPPKQYKTPVVYSTKVFVGGLPWDITEEDITKEFGVFGPCRVEWTNKEKFNLLSSGSIQIQSGEAPFDQNNSNNYQNSSYRSSRSIGGLPQNGKPPLNLMNGPNNMNINGQQNNSVNNNSNANSNNGNNNSDPLNASKHRLSPGFAYVIYESEYSVRSLVGNCIEDYANGRDRVEYYFKISTRRVRNKEVQIIPWILADNNFALCTPKELDPKKTVFVGNLHGTMTARDLAHIMNELFGSVLYAGIDIDKLKYPIGSGRVTFSHQQNFMRAVRAAFVDIQSSKFSKRIQIDPYLEDVQCCACYSDKGIYFCRDFQCFNYYCGNCWDKQHSFNQLGNHKPLMRKREDKL